MAASLTPERARVLDNNSRGRLPTQGRFYRRDPKPPYSPISPPLALEDSPAGDRDVGAPGERLAAVEVKIGAWFVPWSLPSWLLRMVHLSGAQRR
jgi:hypothetical protein